MLESLSMYEKIFDFSPDGIIICDTLGTLVKFNPATQKLFGYEKEELVNQNIDIFLPPLFRDTHRNYFSGFTQCPRPRTMAEDKPLQGIKKDGSTVSLSISITKIPSKNDGDLFLAIIRDVSNNVLKSQKLEKASLQLQEALKLSKIGNWEYDLVEDQLEWSKEVFELFELEEENFFPSVANFNALVHEEDREHVVKTFQDSLTNQIPYNIVHRYITPSGHTKYLRERGRNIYNTEGKVVKTIGTVQDVTEVQKQKVLLNDSLKKLENKNKELEEYLYITTHDLQEPISNLKGIITIFKEEIKSGDVCEKEIDNYLNLMAKSSQRISNLIKGLMEITQVGMGSSISTLDSRLILEESIKNLRKSIQEKKANIQVTSHLPFIYGIKFDLILLFQNLLSNAITYSKKNIHPIIKISSHSQGHSFLFIVEDNGIGIDPKHKDKLFKMFRRLHVQSEIEGRGIGLAQCKKIVEQHNGDIWFESEPGKGSVFYFTLRNPKNL